MQGILSFDDLSITRNVFTTKGKKATPSFRSKIVIMFCSLLVVLTSVGYIAMTNQTVVDHIKLNTLEKWNTMLQKYGIGREPVEITITDPVFVEAVVDWAVARGRGMANVSRPLVEKFVVIAFAESENHGVDPLLTLAVIAVESQFNFMATSRAGAKGLMQIIPKWHPEKISVAEVYDPALNIKAGTQVLREYLNREKGDINRALLRYNGALHIPGVNYDSKVLTAKRDLRRAIEQRLVDNYKTRYSIST
jgi:hypothetical protein